MNKSPFYLRCLQISFYVGGGYTAFLNTSLTADALKVGHGIGGSAVVGIGMPIAIALTLWEAALGHAISNFSGAKDILDWISDSWAKGWQSRSWLIAVLLVALPLSIRIYQIDTTTTYEVLARSLSPDMAASAALLMVISLEVSLIVGGWIGRQRKTALNHALKNDTGKDVDVAFYRSQRKAQIATAKQLGSQHGANTALSRYNKALPGGK